MKNMITFLALALCSWTANAEVPMAATEHSHGTATAINSAIQSPTAIRYYLPDLSMQVLETKTPPRIGWEGFYALVVEQADNNSIKSEVRYSHKNGRPFSAHPADLFALQKTALEIEPTPHPAEHASYHAGKSWTFLVRLNGQPQPNIPVQFKTDNGTDITLLTDTDGKVSITLPDDFTEVKPGYRANAPAEFTLTAIKQHDTTLLQSSFVGLYEVSPSHWQSLYGGIAMACFGVLLGVFVTPRIGNKPLKPKKYPVKSS
jgi:hypothetical protein